MPAGSSSDSPASRPGPTTASSAASRVRRLTGAEPVVPAQDVPVAPRRARLGGDRAGAAPDHGAQPPTRGRRPSPRAALSRRSSSASRSASAAASSGIWPSSASRAGQRQHLDEIRAQLRVHGASAAAAARAPASVSQDLSPAGASAGVRAARRAPPGRADARRRRLRRAAAHVRGRSRGGHPPSRSRRADARRASRSQAQAAQDRAPADVDRDDAQHALVPGQVDLADAGEPAAPVVSTICTSSTSRASSNPGAVVVPLVQRAREDDVAGPECGETAISGRRRRSPRSDAHEHRADGREDVVARVAARSAMRPTCAPVRSRTGWPVRSDRRSGSPGASTIVFTRRS